ncbi:MAG: arylsulfatase [Oscillospiraceae bacterium]|nr:arylsulfatase [Oscillospiraceae bacterium]
MGKPNVVVMLADDLGYGDVSCMNPDGRIKTPNIDSIAQGGLRFTDAHAASSICSPSRYALLTGRYCWRKMRMGIVGVYGDTILPPGRVTMADFLRGKGYATACFGKWHLGMGFRKVGPPPERGRLPEVDFSAGLSAGPTTNGFDEYFGVDVPNWPPYCYIENGALLGSPEGEIPIEVSRQGISIKGPCVPDWKLEDILPSITGRTCEFIERSAAAGKPFFAYLPFTSPHTPMAVNGPWQGISGLNRYADYVMETDAMVGRVLEAVRRSGADGETLVIFASDNGCAYHDAEVPLLESLGHYPSGGYRGYKSDAWDGGHRIPFAVRWPGKVAPGGVYGHPVCLTDVFRTVAEAVGYDVPDTAAEDSVSFMPALEGHGGPVREILVSHSCGGKFAVRKGPWKLILCAGSGGFNSGAGDGLPTDGRAAEMGMPPYQLYDMDGDAGEKANLYGSRPDIVRELVGALKGYAESGRSTPGAPQPNDLPEIVLDPEGTAGLLDDLLIG